MEIVTKGLFKLDPAKNYVIIDKNRVEHGTLEISKDIVSVICKNNEDIDFDNPLDLEKWLTDNEYILTSDSIRWIEYNPNPGNSKKANDCSIRAYCAAENIEWDEAYDIACTYGKADYYMPNDGNICKKILEEEFGYTYYKLKKEERGITVKEFAINHPEGIYVLDLTKHLVTIIDGEYYDSWDSGDKKIKGYYKK